VPLLCALFRPLFALEWRLRIERVCPFVGVQQFFLWSARRSTILASPVGSFHALSMTVSSRNCTWRRSDESLFVIGTIRSAHVGRLSSSWDSCFTGRVHPLLVARDELRLSKAARHVPWKAKARGCLSPCTAWRRVMFSADEVEGALHARPWPGGASGIVRRWCGS